MRDPNEEFARNEICKLSNKLITPLSEGEGAGAAWRATTSGLRRVLRRPPARPFVRPSFRPSVRRRPWEPPILNPLNPRPAWPGLARSNCPQLAPSRSRKEQFCIFVRQSEPEVARQLSKMTSSTGPSRARIERSLLQLWIPK